MIKGFKKLFLHNYFPGNIRSNLSPAADIKLTGRIKHSLEVFNFKGKSVLIIGDSYGWYALNALKQKALKVVSLDIAKPSTSISELESKYKNFHHSINSILTIKFKEKFDICVFLEVIEHLPTHTERIAIENISNCLKRSGIFFMSTPYSSLLSYITDPAILFGHRHYSEKQIKTYLTDAKYNKINIYRGGYIWSVIEILSLYFYKWILKRKFDSRISEYTNSEYPHHQGITLFSICQKS